MIIELCNLAATFSRVSSSSLVELKESWRVSVGRIVERYPPYSTSLSDTTTFSPISSSSQLRACYTERERDPGPMRDWERFSKNKKRKEKIGICYVYAFSQSVRFVGLHFLKLSKFSLLHTSLFQATPHPFVIYKMAYLLR